MCQAQERVREELIPCATPGWIERQQGRDKVLAVVRQFDMSWRSRTLQSAQGDAKRSNQSVGHTVSRTMSQTYSLFTQDLCQLRNGWRAEWNLATNKLVQNHTNRPKIGGDIVALRLQDLWCLQPNQSINQSINQSTILAGLL
jgi:hypothetical protein